MRCIEQFIQSKTGLPETCEDGIVMTMHHVAVIDGATNKSGLTFSSSSPGRMAMQLASESIAAFPPGIHAEDAIEVINSRIQNWYQTEGILELVRDLPPSRCTASLVIYSNCRRELWFLGDCQAIANGQSYQFSKEIDRVLSDLRSLLIHAQLAQGMTESQLQEQDSSRERLMEFLKLQSLFQNSPHTNEFTYHVIDGLTSGLGQQVIVVPVAENTNEIVLCSDGYPNVFPTLAQCEADLAEVLAQDPLCYKRFRSTKGWYKGNLSFDDRSYIRFTL